MNKNDKINNTIIFESCISTVQEVFGTNKNDLNQIKEIFNNYFNLNIDFILELFENLKNKHPCNNLSNNSNSFNPMFITHMLLMINDLKSKSIKNYQEIILKYIKGLKILRKNKNCIVFPRIFDFNKKIFGINNMVFTKSINMESNEYKLYYFDSVFDKNIKNNNQKLSNCSTLNQKIIDTYINNFPLITKEDNDKLFNLLMRLEHIFWENEKYENKIMNRHPEYIHFNRFLHQKVVDLVREIEDYELEINNKRIKIKQLEDDIKILNINYEFQYENKNYFPISYYINPKNIIGSNIDCILISEFKYIQMILRIRYLESSINNFKNIDSKLIYEKEQSDISTIYYEKSNVNYSNILLKYKNFILDMDLKIEQLESNLQILITSCL